MLAGELYRLLMAGGTRDSDFCRHVLACPLALAHGESGRKLDVALGLSANDVTSLLLCYFPHAAAFLADRFSFDGQGDQPVSLEEPDLRTLLRANASQDGPQAVWLAHIVARRSLESNHLWQDLGFIDRTDLSRLMRDYFAPLAQANARDMKWKKFFYRELCQQEGMSICKSPVCDSCPDFSICFSREDGPSLLAQIARAAV
ncbi:nitrogen fixation protein NifQ [Magnetospirillum sulfuroxidans]|uniref:Nitrogen fixation protein NifQ n=1 Tax=Magnetospirillum sulfuroxidans TaxID=611300 RepID=A0ABS5IHT8_9PROT|nr:nitrogen fixation protein NifQ [Magnetospirillum sulfuroxidans]MBR9973328.1 nitrogen fixation protein NifQ [Magnetospirillum sulfuroxidans]